MVGKHVVGQANHGYQRIHRGGPSAISSVESDPALGEHDGFVTWRSALLGGGVVIALLGLMFLPFGYHGNPKRSLSAFSHISDTGTFVKEGLALIAVGLITAVLSRFLPGDDDD